MKFTILAKTELFIVEVDDTKWNLHKVAGSKGISETNLKIKIPCTKCMHRTVMSQADACTSQAYACMYCIHCPWDQRLMQAVTAWALLFWFRLGYIFISSYFESSAMKIKTLLTFVQYHWVMLANLAIYWNL
jgi:hypothetical protein